MSSFDVVGLGQCAFDAIGRLPELPAEDSKTELDELLLQGGGPVATALVTLARLGARPAFVGCCGDDDFGRRLRAELLAEGVDCEGLRLDPGRSSQFAFIAVTAGGRRTIFWHRGSALPIDPAELDPAAIRSARVLHLDGLQHEASLAAARIARESGVITVLDGGTLREGAATLLPLIDHLVVSERFARQFVPDDPSAALERLLAFGAQAVTVTQGMAGSHTLTRGGEQFHQVAFPAPVVDTTGCGDVFHGGYLFGLLEGWDIRRTIRFAAACAALKTRALGGRTAIPRREEVERFLDRHPGR